MWSKDEANQKASRSIHAGHIHLQTRRSTDNQDMDLQRQKAGPPLLHTGGYEETSGGRSSTAGLKRRHDVP